MCISQPLRQEEGNVVGHVLAAQVSAGSDTHHSHLSLNKTSHIATSKFEVGEETPSYHVPGKSGELGYF